MDKPPKFRELVVAFNELTLGISMVVAVFIGVGIGLGLEKLFGVWWLFWVGVFFGVSAAILNVYKAYKRQIRDFEKLKEDPKYSYKKHEDKNQ